ncbi:stage V sporulation protein D (sporulation-specific penicillin-binding protein) [Acetitomaculum ruminis DSM 5522]|uniref:Stage V sporulation protein D (Sporulation-specific penicillin-binding protein) n=1 Tax=Acetitomaculum ruminis DSM 5522 TaxID=1120918 RepID=A0A1I0VV61_9FIRM|nr:penicillin-binding transpeptidase domain-containing protein [Acetitomaculum ruminis]SFA80194.1 stage V sporulation protein D (sporulation-specific penicillin-binding protein) [Acetitomaculum ruminis DSM 5522]
MTEDRRSIHRKNSKKKHKNHRDNIKSNSHGNKTRDFSLYQLAKHMKKRLRLTFSFFIIIFLVVAIRIVYINATNGADYQKIALSQLKSKSTTKTLAYKRGTIYDTNGNILAISEDSYNLVLDCYVITTGDESRNSRLKENDDSRDIYKKSTIEAITTNIEGLDEKTITAALEKSPNSHYVVLNKDNKYSYDQVKSLMGILEDDKKNTYLGGIWLEKIYTRKYPFKSLASSVIGYTSSGNKGNIGLELEYDEELNGTEGKIYSYIGSENEKVENIKEAEDGNSIVTTIDSNIQKIVEDKINQFNDEHANVAREGAGSKKTAVMVMNPNNGEILAMAQYPQFDLNDPSNLSVYYTQEQIAAMSDEDKTNALNEIWNNYCLTATFEPGSTVKPFTIAAALEDGVIKPSDTFYCDGSEKIGSNVIHCGKRSGHGAETLEDALSNSCNDVLMQIGGKIGIESFTNWQNIFGFGLKTQIDLPGEASTASLMYTAETMKEIDLATNSFGQGYNITMIQNGAAFCSVINGGYYYQPHVVKRITDSDGNTVKANEGTLVKQTITKETSDLLKSYMYTATISGTAKAAKVEGYSMGGKTGTAEKLPRGNKKYVLSFIGYAPQTNPQVVIYVVVDELNDADQTQGKYSSGLARDILTEILPYMNIYPDE